MIPYRCGLCNKIIFLVGVFCIKEDGSKQAPLEVCWLRLTEEETPWQTERALRSFHSVHNRILHAAIWSWLWITEESGSHIGYYGRAVITNGEEWFRKPSTPHVPCLCNRIKNISSSLQFVSEAWRLENTTKWVSAIRPREEACLSDTHIPRKCDRTLSENKWHVSKNAYRAWSPFHMRLFVLKTAELYTHCSSPTCMCFSLHCWTEYKHTAERLNVGGLHTTSLNIILTPQACSLHLNLPALP